MTKTATIESRKRTAVDPQYGIGFLSERKAMLTFIFIARGDRWVLVEKLRNASDTERREALERTLDIYNRRSRRDSCVMVSIDSEDEDRARAFLGKTPRQENPDDADL